MARRHLAPAALVAASLIPAIRPAAHAQEPPPFTIAGTYEHELRSEGNGREYRLFVSLPRGYEASDTTRHPVLFVLDGNIAFPAVVATQRMLTLFGEIPELMVVGVGYPAGFYMETVAFRWYDYTPSRVSAADSARSAQVGVEVRSGGGAEFLRFLREEAIPFVDAHYRTTDDRAIWGHSLGGLFAGYALLEVPDLFDRYVMSSPSLNFAGDAMFVREAAFADSHEALPARVFISVGSEEADLIGPAERFAGALRGRRYEGLVLESHVFDDETHVSVFPAAISRGLRFLYAPEAVNPSR